MTKQIVLLALPILSLVTLTGCPGAGSAVVGSWVITFNGPDYGMTFLANGQVIPFEIDAMLFGTFSWEQEGNRVVLHHVDGDSKVIWTAELTSNTTMNGAWIIFAGANAGVSNTWAGVKQ